MKKQFLRYKLIADQKVGRANKSEVLNDELLQVEKHMDHVKTACAATYKKLIQCNHSHGAGDFDKRLKRLKESELAQGMLDASKTLLGEPDSNHMLGNSLKVCGEVQADLAKEKTMYEMFIDDHVVLPLQTLVETEIPSIIKLRERLKRLVLDRDSAFQNLNRGKKAQYAAGANIQQAQVKLESLNDEYSQAVSRMEQCKDQLITEMFEFVANEAGHNQRISDFHAKQLDYHRRCVKVLESTAPKLEDIQNNAVSKCSYGKPLKDHLKASEREIALPIEACTLCIIHMGIKEEGIFRIGGGATKLRKFRALVDGGVLDLFDYDAQDDIHAVAGAMKQYLRDLPDPLLTHRLHNDWIAAASISEEDQKLQELWRIIDNLPPENQANLKYLAKFFSLVAQYQDVNKMSPSNLSVVLAPNMLWTHMDDISTRMVESSLIAGLVELIITYADWFFPGEMDFVVTPNGTSYHMRSDSNASLEKVPLSPTVPKKSPSHSRSSSSDINLEAGQTNLQTPQPSSSTLKKRKSKAPRPPQLPPQVPAQDSAPKTHERKRSSPTLGEAPAVLPNAANRPPVAAQRKSNKKPQVAPPHPPEELPREETHPPQNGPTPKPKPRPPVRKHKSNEPDRPQSITDPSIFLPPDGVVVGEPQSPPMPDQAPPPLPPTVELDGLASELRIDSDNPFPAEDECELTCL